MDMSIRDLSGNLTSLQRTYLFSILIPSVVGGGDSRAISIRTQKAEIPAIEYGAINVPYKATPGINFHGKKNIRHEWSLSFIEGEDAAIATAFTQWGNAVVDSDSGLSNPDPSLKTDAYVELTKTDGSVAIRYKIVGIFVKTLTPGRLDQKSEEGLTYDVVFSCDDVVVAE